MKTKSEIAQIRGTLRTLRSIVPGVLFLLVLLILAGGVGLGFGLSAIIAFVAGGAAFVTFSLMLNRWAGL